MLGRKAATALIVAIVLISGTAVSAQFGRSRDGFSVNPVQNDPPPTEFIMARWHFSARGGGWAHDYPAAEEHILEVMTETSIINAEIKSYRIVELSSPEIFDYPFSYISEPGEMSLSDQEVDNFREYVSRGGFVMVDDFGGQGSEARELETFLDNMERVFPDLEMLEITPDHPIFHNFYDIASINAVHPMTDAKSIFYAYPDGRDGIAVLVCFRADVGDFWERINERRYRVEPSAEALKMGLNFIHWAMTH